MLWSRAVLGWDEKSGKEEGRFDEEGQRISLSPAVLRAAAAAPVAALSAPPGLDG